MASSSSVRKTAGTDNARALALTDLHREKYVTQNALARVVRQIRERGLPPASSPSTQRRARQQLCGDRTPYGCVVQEFEVQRAGAEAPELIAIQHPCAMMWVLAKESPRFRALLRNCLAREPSTPR